MPIPFKAVGSDPKDAYTYFHLQVCINIECSCPMFGLLRSAMPTNFTINKIHSLVQAMCKLHNFYISNDGEEVPTTTSLDEALITTKEGVGLPQLIGGGEHRDDHNHHRLHNCKDFPREASLQIVTENDLRCCVPKKWQETISLN